MQPQKFLISAALTLTCVLPLAQAEDWYAETFIAGVLGSENGSRLSTSSTAVSSIGLRGGYKLNPNLSLEVEGQRGLDGDENRLVLGLTGDIDLNAAYALYGKYSLPVSERISVHARAGLASTEYRAELESGLKFKENSQGFAIGVGTELGLTDTLYLRGDVTQYDTDARDSTAISVGAGVRF